MSFCCLVQHLGYQGLLVETTLTVPPLAYISILKSVGLVYFGRFLSDLESVFIARNETQQNASYNAKQSSRKPANYSLLYAILE